MQIVKQTMQIREDINWVQENTTISKLFKKISILTMEKNYYQKVVE